MMQMIDDIIRITLPFSGTWEHVQGPGGNTSVKENGAMLIKASGYTFKNIIAGSGLVWINNGEVCDKIAQNFSNNSLESLPVRVTKSMPEGLRPSMEFEFHAVLDKYVLHTHSIYVNIATCSTESGNILDNVFPDIPFVQVPYLVPGHPLAAHIYQKIAAGERAGIYFLKNHGIIVHGDHMEEVLDTYDLVQQRFIKFFALNPVNTVPLSKSPFSFSEISNGWENMAIADIVDRVIVPDQSIFFHNKVSDSDPLAAVYFDTGNKKITINGSDKFAEAAVAMLRMVYYVISNHQRLSLASEFISKNDLDILGRLSSEKYRKSIL